MYRFHPVAPCDTAVVQAAEGITATSWSQDSFASEVTVPDGPPAAAAVWNIHCAQPRFVLITVISEGGVSPSSFWKV